MMRLKVNLSFGLEKLPLMNVLSFCPYARSQSELYHTGLRVAALAETGIGLAINNRVEIITNFRYKMHLRNWSTDELVVKPRVFLIGTGIQFKF